MKHQTKKKRKNKKKNKKIKKIYTKKEYNSNDGILTSVWGPPAWHFLHTISFNYPVEPTKQQKQHYKLFFSNLEWILPCGYCRKNFKKNIKKLPLTREVLKNRDNFSRWVFNFHELINKMLCKKSGLTYGQVRERYEHFRSRCTLDKTRKVVKKKNI